MLPNRYMLNNLCSKKTFYQMIIVVLHFMLALGITVMTFTISVKQNRVHVLVSCFLSRTLVN